MTAADLDAGRISGAISTSTATHPVPHYPAHFGKGSFFTPRTSRDRYARSTEKARLCPTICSGSSEVRDREGWCRAAAGQCSSRRNTA